MGLTPEQQALREGHITASFLPALMAGIDHEIFHKWLELIGDPSWQPKIPNWQMAWGSYGEPFVLDWHQAKTPDHPLIRRGEFVEHPTKKYVGCTLDAYRAFDDCAIDAKVCQAFKPIDEHIAFYTPQLIVQRACLQCTRAALLLVHGNSEPTEYQIAIDAEYEKKLWQRVDLFQWHVENMVEPVRMPMIVPPEQWTTIDLDADGARYNWAQDMRDYLRAWDRTKPEADVFNAAKDEIKKLLPADCGKLFCEGAIVSRNRSNAVSIKRR